MGVVLLFELELGDVLLSVLVSLGGELFALVDFLEDGGEVVVGLGELSLELSVLSIELIDSLFEVFNGLGLIKSELVEGFNDVISELVEGFDDLSEDSLVGEVLGGGKLNKCADDGSLLDLVPAGLGDSVDGTLKLLDLSEGWVAEGLDQFKSIIDGSSGLVVLSNKSLVVFVVLFSEKGSLDD